MAIKISGNTVIDDSQNITATGAATFVGNVLNGDFSAGDGNLIGANGFISIRKDGAFYDSINIYNGGTSSTDRKVAISNTGAATFAGGNIILNADGSATFTSINPIVTDQPSSGNIANPAIQIKHDGTINGSWRHDGRLEVGGQDANAEITLSPDGSASFAGVVTGTADYNTFTASVTLANEGTSFRSTESSAGSSSKYHFFGSANGTNFCNIATDGSATFAGGDAVINSYGQLVITRSDSNAYPSLTINSAGTTTNTIDLNGDGSATFAGTITANGGVSFTAGQLVESVNVTAGTLASASDIDLSTGMVHYFTTQESTQVTPNLMVSGKSVNQIMAVGEAISVVIMLTASASGYMSSMTIDGASVTPMWSSGIAPSEGGASGIDVYTLQVIKTANSTYTVIANSSNFA